MNGVCELCFRKRTSERISSSMSLCAPWSVWDVERDASKPTPPDHDVVEECNTDHARRQHDPRCQRDVLLAGGRITAWVIVNEKKCRGLEAQRCPQRICCANRS